jgi:hypothetical protein
MRKSFIAILLLTQYLTIPAMMHIKGDIGGMVFEKSNNPYIVEEDIIIPTGQSVTVKEGCIILFQSFTGLSIFGSIAVEGTEEDPVLFSTFNDGAFNDSANQLPKAFDWNGILIDRSASKINFRNFRVWYSVFGIKSKKESITLINGIFKENGQFNFTINDDIQMVQDKVSYSYGAKKEQDARRIVDSTRITASKDREIIKLRLDSQQHQGKTKYNTPIYVSMTSALVFGIGAVVFGVIANDNRKKYESYGPDNWDANGYNRATNNFKIFRGCTIGAAATTGVSAAVWIALASVKQRFLKKNKNTTAYFGRNAASVAMGIVQRF